MTDEPTVIRYRARHREGKPLRVEREAVPLFGKSIADHARELVEECERVEAELAAAGFPANDDRVP